VKLGDESYEFIARRHGNGTRIGHLNVRHGWLDLWLPPGVAVKGIVKDQQGQPIADAQIRVNWKQEHELPEGILKSRTDARGEFEIDDAPEAAIFHVSHPDYLSDGFKRTAKADRHFQALPNPVEITLKKAGVIEGQVVLGDTGQPAAGVVVTLQELGWDGASDNRFRWFHPHATTDSAGRYRFRTLPAQRFNLSVRGGPQGLASAGIDALEVRLGQTVEAPLLRLAKGGLVHGRLINNISGKPQTVREDHVLSIGIASAAEPKAKPAVENLHVRADGTFEFWLPPGKSSAYLSGGPFFAVGDAEQGIGHDRREIDVKPGTEYSVEFRVVRIGPTRISDRPRTQRGS
jgi:Carboxypeptidase regulatory-like domain